MSKLLQKYVYSYIITIVGSCNLYVIKYRQEFGKNIKTKRTEWICLGALIVMRQYIYYINKSL